MHTLLINKEVNAKKQTIIKWVLSCRTQEQLNLSKELYKPLIYNIYRGKAHNADLLFAHMEINEAIEAQEKILATQKTTRQHEQPITAIC